MHKILITAIFIVLTLFGATARAQTPFESTAEKSTPTLTATEEAEARELVTRYYARLAETNSIGPLLDEYHTRDSVEHFKQKMLHDLTVDTDGEGKTGMERGTDAILAMDDATWRRFSVGIVDLLYLLMVRSWVDSANGEENGLFDAIPPRAQAIMRYNPNLAHILDDTPGEERFANAAEIEDFLNTLEAAEAIMREELQGKPSPLVNGVRGTESETDETEPRFRLRILDREEHNRPEGTRVIEVELPIALTLTIVREDGVLRVVAIEMIDD